MAKQAAPKPGKQTMKDRSVWALAAGMLTTAGAYAQPSYQIESLELPPDAIESRARAVNSFGHVAGAILVQESDMEIFIPTVWIDGQPTPLPIPPGYPGASLTGISEVGIVCGTAWSNGTFGFSAAAVWVDGQAALIPTLGGLHSAADAIAPDGVITGWTSMSGQFTGMRAYRYDGQTKNTGLPPRPEIIRTVGRAINNKRQIAGNTTTAHGFTTFLDDPEEGMIIIGTLGGRNASANGISDAGHVVGHSETGVPDSSLDGQTVRAFLWQSGRMTDLGVLPDFIESRANDVNSDGIVVGFCLNHPGPDQPRRAFVWIDGVMTDLNDLIPAGTGWELSEARAINETGQIVGNGILDGQRRAFLLTPTP